MLTGVLSTLYRYARKSLPGPGSENIAFLDEWLPYQTPIGPAQANRMQLLTYPAGLAPQVVMLQPPIAGIPTGQWFDQPLSVPPPS